MDSDYLCSHRGDIHALAGWVADLHELGSGLAGQTCEFMEEQEFAGCMPAGFWVSTRFTGNELF